MKQKSRILILASLLVAIVAPASLAAFSVPYDAYRMDYLDRAQEEARYHDKPITFVYSNEYTDCGLATAASVDAFNYLEGQTVIVYAEREDWGKIPPIVQRAINSEKAGTYIPITVIVDPAMSKVLSIVPYIRNAKLRKQTLQQVSSSIAY